MRSLPSRLALSLSFFLVLVVPGSAFAQLVFTQTSGTESFWGGTAYDTANGNYYRLDGFSPGNFGDSFNIKSYLSQSDFELGANGTAINIQRYGTGFAALDGYLYGHATETGGMIGKWNIATGELVATASFAGFGDRNGTDTYNWGGYSAMNVFNDNGVLYLLSGSGTSSGSEFHGSVAVLNSDLTISNSHSFILPSSLDNPQYSYNGAFGWGFANNGKFYGSNAFNNNSSLNYKIDLSSGSVSANTIALTGLYGSYITNANYVQATDTLYVWDANALYKASGISSVLEIAAVPEPATWAMMIAGFGLVGSALRRRRAEQRVSIA